MIKTGIIGVFVFSFSLFLPHPVSAAVDRVFTVSPKPTGGTVVVSGWINCGDGGDVCSVSFPINSDTAGYTFEFVGKPSSNYYFFSWEGECASHNSVQCILGMEADHTVSAVFKLMSLITIKPPAHGSINVFRAGYVNSIVWFQDGGSCNSIAVVSGCNRYYFPGVSGGQGPVQLKFTITPDTGYSFAGWTDDCNGSSTAECFLNTSQDRIVGATFQLNPVIPSDNIPASCVDVDGNDLINEIDCGDVRNTNCSAPLCGGANPENPPADEEVLPGSGDEFNPPSRQTSVTNSPFSWQINNPFKGGVDSVMGLLAVLANFIFQLGIPVAVIIIIYSGVTYLTAGTSDRVKRGTNGLKYAALGLAILLIGKGFVALIQSILSIR